jgi:hypothetical protein
MLRKAKPHAANPTLTEQFRCRSLTLGLPRKWFKAKHPDLVATIRSAGVCPNG